jgi:ribosomal protein S18 acetylase RimI-like enzyme
MTDPRIRITDVLDEAGFQALPPCADPGFDHRTCDYWEDAARGSKASRLAWLEATPPSPDAGRRPAPANPFLADATGARADAPNPFAPPAASRPANPFLDEAAPAIANPFAPPPPPPPAADPDAPRKWQLLGRGLKVTGSYAKVLYQDDVAAAYCQFGPLTAYPRAQRTRELYPALPDAPLPAVITCIATTAAARGSGLGLRLVAAVCEDLEARGFTAVEAYPEAAARADATSAATPAFWLAAGFALAIADERYPVMRRELA